MSDGEYIRRPGKRKDPAALPLPEVDESVRREARAVGLLAVMFAAGISAQALFSLGRLIGLSAWTAWMLPGAMDLYAFESTRVASQVPAGHPSRGWAVWNARLALSFTVGGNALFHALHLAGGHRGWSHTDVALTAVSAVPPVIVERFLHLQTKINAVGGRAERPVAAAVQSATVQTPQPLPVTAQPTVPSRPLTQPPATAHTHRSPAPATAHQTPAPGAQSPAAVSGRPSMERWVQIGQPVYVSVKAATGRRPAEKAYRDALAGEVARLIAAGHLPAVYADPSVPTAKRVRDGVERKHPELTLNQFVGAATRTTP